MVVDFLDHNAPGRTLSFRIARIGYRGCCRCTGAVCGWAVGCGAFLWTRHDPKAALALLMAAALVALLDRGTEYLRLRSGGNRVRFATGVLLGWSVGGFATAVLGTVTPL